MLELPQRRKILCEQRDQPLLFLVGEDSTPRIDPETERICGLYGCLTCRPGRDLAFAEQPRDVVLNRAAELGNRFGCTKLQDQLRVHEILLGVNNAVQITTNVMEVIAVGLTGTFGGFPCSHRVVSHPGPISHLFAKVLIKAAPRLGIEFARWAALLELAKRSRPLIQCDRAC